MILIGSHSISRTMEPKTTWKMQKRTQLQGAITQHAPVLVVIIKGTRGGGETTDHRENEPPQVSVNGKVNHLLNRVEVWIIQVPQKPQNPRSEHLQHTQTI